MSSPVPSPLRSLAAVAAIGAALALPSAAQARTFFSFGFGFPGFYGPPAFFYPPPVYAPPPVVYAPPPVTYAPLYAPPPASNYSLPSQGAASAPRCFAGAYVCPPDRPGPAGAPCSCPTNTGRARGRIG